VDPPKIVTDLQDILNVIPGHSVVFSVMAAGLNMLITVLQSFFDHIVNAKSADVCDIVSTCIWHCDEYIIHN